MPLNRQDGQRPDQQENNLRREARNARIRESARDGGRQRPSRRETHHSGTRGHSTDATRNAQTGRGGELGPATLKMTAFSRQAHRRQNVAPPGGFPISGPLHINANANRHTKQMTITPSTITTTTEPCCLTSMTCTGAQNKRTISHSGQRTHQSKVIHDEAAGRSEQDNDGSGRPEGQRAAERGGRGG